MKRALKGLATAAELPAVADHRPPLVAGGEGVRRTAAAEATPVAADMFQEAEAAVSEVAVAAQEDIANRPLRLMMIPSPLPGGRGWPAAGVVTRSRRDG